MTVFSTFLDRNHSDFQELGNLQFYLSQKENTATQSLPASILQHTETSIAPLDLPSTLKLGDCEIPITDPLPTRAWSVLQTPRKKTPPSKTPIAYNEAQQEVGAAKFTITDLNGLWNTHDASSFLIDATDYMQFYTVTRKEIQGKEISYTLRASPKKAYPEKMKEAFEAKIEEDIKRFKQAEYTLHFYLRHFAKEMLDRADPEGA